MYKEHPAFNPPPNDAILWRYMNFTKYVSLLDKQALFFARADKLGDSFEGSYSKVNEALRPKLYDSLPKGTLQGLAKLMKENRRNTLINCWHKSVHESEAMWKLYAREEDGVAIKTDFNSFKNSFKCEKEIYIGEVDYVDYKKHFIPEKNLFSAYLFKRESFKHEQEVRAICSIFERDGIVFENLNNDHIIGVNYEVDLSILIKEVVVAPFAQDWFLDLVKSVTTRYKFNINITRSTQAENPTWG